MVKLLTTEDLWGREEYEQQRDAFRRKIMAAKQPRRVLVGPNCSVHIENRDIMRYQVLEMLRAEGTWDDPQAVADELEAYNPLISRPNLLSVTMMFEYPTEEERETELPKLVGIDRHFWLAIGESDPVLGEFDAGQIDEDKVSSVQFVKFPLDDEQQSHLAQAGTVARLIIDHPHYTAQAVLGEQTRECIAADLSA